MVSKTLEQATEETKIEMTPMIDVTFLLLIFFMCSIKFKVLEGKLPTFLPKEAGVQKTPLENPLEKVDVRIERAISRGALDLDTPTGFAAWKAAGWRDDQVRITVMGRPIASLPELDATLTELRRRIPAPDSKSTPSGADDLKMNIDAAPGVIYEDVVRVVDAAIAAGFADITFRGIDKDA